MAITNGALRDAMLAVADSPAPLLITGETGVGKDIAAQAVHAASGLRGPLVAVNCGAIPDTLIESELFGCVRGAFTGAQARDGLVERAKGGTLFLDEIGELPLAVQPTLLRFLDSGEYRRVGEAGTRRASPRIVAATNVDLLAASRRGRFRQDLYYRLAVLRLRVPPLRERLAEMPELINEFAPGAELSSRAIEAMFRHPWPGNIRELRNVMTRAQVAARGRVICVDHLGLDADVEANVEPEVRLGAYQDMFLDAIQAALVKKGGNVRAAARLLGVSHTTIYRALLKAGR